MLRLVQDAKYPVKCKVKTNKKRWQAKLLLYILSVSQTSCWVRRWILFSGREEFRIFCRSFDWPIEILTTCPIEDNNNSYSNHAPPSKLVFLFCFVLIRDIDNCMVNGNRNTLSFSQDKHFWLFLHLLRSWSTLVSSIHLNTFSFCTQRPGQ